MDAQLFLGFLLSILPITELRAGIPLILEYCLRNNINWVPFFLAVVLLNVLVIFFIYFFLEKIHTRLLKIKKYSNWFHKFIDKLRRKHEKFEKKFNEAGYLALAIFVAVPLPGTGVWTATLLAWIIGLEKKKSIIAMSLGVLIAGLIVLLSSLGILKLFYN
jgi:uncharacterized membrane protein